MRSNPSRHGDVADDHIRLVLDEAGSRRLSVIGGQFGNTGADAGIVTSMEKSRKITVEVPADVLRRAQKVSREGVTATVRRALEDLAGNEAYDKLLELRGTVQFTESLDRLREDRD